MAKPNQSTYSLPADNVSGSQRSKRDATFLGIGVFVGMLVMALFFHLSPDLFDYIVYVFGGFLS
ncbi:hypothetical protein [Thaumasiovibrio subtropicus]|uniref:hypothetical protein n=1 Tax=Thaumasiovibrio subtropicus TaxID=1891207 RepID=UPI000B35E336|nr:hypothetical protein [Thaumasiovibrio subtropicus]